MKPRRGKRVAATHENTANKKTKSVETIEDEVQSTVETQEEKKNNNVENNHDGKWCNTIETEDIFWHFQQLLPLQ